MFLVIPVMTVWFHFLYFSDATVYLRPSQSSEDFYRNTWVEVTGSFISLINLKVTTLLRRCLHSKLSAGHQARSLLCLFIYFPHTASKISFSNWRNQLMQRQNKIIPKQFLRLWVQWSTPFICVSLVPQKQTQTTPSTLHFLWKHLAIVTCCSN